MIYVIRLVKYMIFHLAKKGDLKFSSILILLLFALFTNHSDPPSRGQDLENRTGSDCVDKKAMNSAFKA